MAEGKGNILISGIIVVLMIVYSLIPLSFHSQMGQGEPPGAMAPTGMFDPFILCCLLIPLAIGTLFSLLLLR